MFKVFWWDWKLPNFGAILVSKWEFLQNFFKIVQFKIPSFKIDGFSQTHLTHADEAPT